MNCGAEPTGFDAGSRSAKRDVEFLVAVGIDDPGEIGGLAGGGGCARPQAAHRRAAMLQEIDQQRQGPHMERKVDRRGPYGGRYEFLAAADLRRIFIRI